MGTGARRSAVGELHTLLEEVIGEGDLVAIGGCELERKPMAAVRALAEVGCTVRVATLLGSADVETLLAAGCVAELHTAGVALRGLAPRWREARQKAALPVIEWSEGTFIASLQATVLGAGSLLWPTGADTDLPKVNPWLMPTVDPHTGTPVVAVRALVPDVALLHVHGVDDDGNAYIDGDVAADALLARAARFVFVTYERRMKVDPGRAALSRLWIDAAVAAPRGAWPTGCRPLYDHDAQGLERL